MRAINVSRYTEPSGYEYANVPRPTIVNGRDIIIQVRAASINPLDAKRANGFMKPLTKEKFPYILGLDIAGTVVEVGSDVVNFKPGDEVFACLAEKDRGAWAEYARSDESHLALKPDGISFVEAAAVPLAAMTAFQALQHGKGSLEGKTVFIPGGLSGVGSYGIQLAKNHFKAGKVITSVSTAKVTKISEFLGEGVVDQIIDYTKEDPAQVIPHGSVDFLLDTMTQAAQFLPLMKPETSSIVSISGIPSGKQANSVMVKEGGEPVPKMARMVLEGIFAYHCWRATRARTNYGYMFVNPNGNDLTTLAGLIRTGSLRPVVGSVVSFNNIEAVQAACKIVLSGKGGLGKAVMELDN